MPRIATSGQLTIGVNDGAADAAEVGDREAAALHVVERELAGARLLRRLRQLGGQLRRCPCDRRRGSPARAGRARCRRRRRRASTSCRRSRCAPTSTDALNCGNLLQRRRRRSSARSPSRSACRRRFSACGAYCLRSASSAVMSALSCCVTCGMTFHACDRCSAVLRRMLLIGLRSISPHLREVGQRNCRRARRPAAAGERALDERLHVVDADAAGRAAAGDPPDVDAELARQAPHGRRGWRRRALGLGRRWRRRLRRRLSGARRRRGCRRPRRASAWFPAPALPSAVLGGDRLGAAALSVFRPASRRRPASASPCRPASSSALRRLAGAFVDRQHDLADLDLLALLDLDLLDRAGDRRRHFDRRLVGLELEDRLVFRHRVARRHQHANDIAGGDVLAEFGEREVCWHVSALACRLITVRRILRASD